MLHAVVLLLAVAHAPQTAPAAAAQDSGITVEGERKPPKKICKRSTPTGSLMPKVTCRTPQEIQLEQDNAIVGMEQLKSEARARQNVQNSRELQP